MDFPESFFGFPRVTLRIGAGFLTSCLFPGGGVDLSLILSALSGSQFFCVLGFRTGTPPEGPYQWCVNGNLQPQCVLCLCRTMLVLTVAAEDVPREVAIWAAQCPHKDSVKAGPCSVPRLGQWCYHLFRCSHRKPGGSP